MTARHTIKAVSNKTGISPHLIRAWERRYNAVIPERTDTNRRLYSDDDIERLSLLYAATQKGESIGQVASLPTDQLKIIAGDLGQSGNGLNIGEKSGRPAEIEIINRCVELTGDLDRAGLYKILLKSEAGFSKPVLLENVIIPFMHKIGDLWEDGTLKVVHEHLASAVVRSFLGELLISQKIPESGPSIIGTTPTGHDHEFGAIIAVLSALSEGWRGIYLGSDLPSEEIAFGAEKYGANVIALSLIYPNDNAGLQLELHRLRRMIGENVTIIAGGKSVDNYATVLRETNAIKVASMAEYRQLLRDIRDTGKYMS